MQDKFIAFHIPDDDEFLAAFGRVALCHAHLDHMLRMLVKTLAGITVAEARLATAREGSQALRDLAKRLSKAAFYKRDEPTHLRVCALLTQAKALTRERNALMHGICAQEINRESVSDDQIWGDRVMLDEYMGQRPLPTAAELLTLASKITQLVGEINEARLHGFIAATLRPAPPVDLKAAPTS